MKWLFLITFRYACGTTVHIPVDEKKKKRVYTLGFCGIECHEIVQLFLFFFSHGVRMGFTLYISY